MSDMYQKRFLWFDYFIEAWYLARASTSQKDLRASSFSFFPFIKKAEKKYSANLQHPASGEEEKHNFFYLTVNK